MGWGGITLSEREGKELCSPSNLLHRTRIAGAAGYGAAAFPFLLPDNADTRVKGRAGDRSRNARLLDATSTPIQKRTQLDLPAVYLPHGPCLLLLF